MVDENKSTAFSLVAMILGIVSVMVSCVPILGLVAVVPGVVGLVFSSTALRKIKKGVASGRGMAMAGLVCSIIGTCFGLIGMLFCSAVIFSAAAQH